MEDANNKRHNFKVEIRRKRIEDKIGIMRANLYQKTMMKTSSDQYSSQKISALIKETLSNKEKLIENISTVMYASYNITAKNVGLFFPLIPDFCYVIDHLEEMQETKKVVDKNMLFSDIITTLINISSFETYEWPPGQYLFLIKHLLKKQRETNTMWLLSNILYQRMIPKTQQALVKELIKYHAVSFCQSRMQRKFDSEYDIDTFANFVCVFLSNSQYLSFDEFKKVLRILQQLSELNNESIDLYIMLSMADHAPHLTEMNYALLHSNLIASFREKYIKKKKSSMIIKFLQFVKVYIGRQISQTFDDANDRFYEQKLAKKNYERICQIILPNLQFLIQNRSPEVSGMVMETCCMLVEFYFPFIDFQHQDIFITMAKRLNKSAIATLSKYSDKAIYWQIRLVRTLLFKLNEHKIQTDIIAGFISENQSLEAFGNLLKDKKENRDIIDEAIELLIMIFQSIQKETLLKNEKNQLYLSIIMQQLQNILDSHLIQDQRVYDKIEKLMTVCQEKQFVQLN